MLVEFNLCCYMLLVNFSQKYNGFPSHLFSCLFESYGNLILSTLEFVRKRKCVILSFLISRKCMCYYFTNRSINADEILALLNERCPEVLDILAVTDVFPTSGDGPRGMAHRYDVPYLGTLPLDPNLLRACEDGVCFVDDFPGSPAVNPINSLVDKILHALPVMEEEELSMEEEDLSMKE